MKADADSVIEAFGKNEHVKKVFWAVFVAMAGVVLARVLDPVTAQQIVGLITGLGDNPLFPVEGHPKWGGGIPSGKISPIRALFLPPVPGPTPEKPVKPSFSFPVENVLYIRSVCRNAAELDLAERPPKALNRAVFCHFTPSRTRKGCRNANMSPKNT